MALKFHLLWRLVRTQPSDIRNYCYCHSRRQLMLVYRPKQEVDVVSARLPFGEATVDSAATACDSTASTCVKICTKSVKSPSRLLLMSSISPADKMADTSHEETPLISIGLPRVKWRDSDWWYHHCVSFWRWISCLGWTGLFLSFSFSLKLLFFWPLIFKIVLLFFRFCDNYVCPSHFRISCRHTRTLICMQKILC